METILMIVSILLIVLVLLQSNKASNGAQIISGGNADLFSKQKERGSEYAYENSTLSSYENEYYTTNLDSEPKTR